MVPGTQVYVTAPAAVNVADEPGQIAVGDATAVTVGLGNTVTVVTAEEVQVPILPTKVQVVFIVGVTANETDTTGPGNQVYDVAPLAFKVVVLPAQTVGVFGKMVNVGVGLTTNVIVRFATQPETPVPFTV